MTENSPNLIKENPKCEYLSRDIFNKDFLKVFSSLYKAKLIFGVNRVDARDLFISPLTMNQKICTVVQTVAKLAVLSVATYSFATNFNACRKLHYIVALMAMLTGLSHLASVLYARFAHNERNVKFHLQLQEIDRQMGITCNNHINGILRNIIRLNVACLGALCAILVLLSYFGGFYLMAMIAALVCCSATNILESSHCSVLLVYFLIRVRFINAVMLNHIEGVSSAEPPRSAVIPTTAVLRLIAAQAYDFRVMDTDIHLKLLFDCFYELQELFQFPIAVHFIIYFIYCWLCVQIIIFGLQYNVYTAVEWTLTPILLFIGLVISFVLIYRSEKFFREVRETKRLSIVILSRHYDGPLWAKARRMHRLAGLRAPRFSVCGLWQLDAAFLVRFFDAVSAMIVTELQFGL